jgi:hypothetical protein
MIETFSPDLLDFGIAGIFIAYLIFDRQYLLKTVVRAITQLTTAINDLDKDIVRSKHGKN